MTLRAAGGAGGSRRSSTPRRRPAACGSTPPRSTSTTSPRRSASPADGGLWLAAVSPAAVERIERIAAADRWIPAVAQPRRAPSTTAATTRPTTRPPLATLILLADHRCEWMTVNGGLAWAAGALRRSRRGTLYGWAEVDGLRHAVRQGPGRSARHVVGTIDLDDPADGRRRRRDQQGAARQRHRRHRQLPQARPQPAAHRHVPGDRPRRRRAPDPLHRQPSSRLAARLTRGSTRCSRWGAAAPPLNSPVLLIALRGWFDTAGVASTPSITSSPTARRRCSPTSTPTRSTTSPSSAARCASSGDRQVLTWPRNDVRGRPLPAHRARHRRPQRRRAAPALAHPTSRRCSSVVRRWASRPS